MPVYTVHAPASVTGGPDTDRAVFVRDGFHVWAAIVPLLWLLWHRLWLALIGYIALTVAAAFALTKLDVGSGVGVAVMALIALLIGLEAASLRRRKLSRGQWRQLDIVVADDREAAERRFFDRQASSTGSRTGLPNSWIDRGPQAPSANYQVAPARDIIGSFPQGGSSR